MPSASDLYRNEVEHGEQLVHLLRTSHMMPKKEKEALLCEIRKIERECGVRLYGDYNSG